MVTWTIAASQIVSKPLLSIPMPPFGGWWCCDGGVLGMVLLLGGVIWFLNWILSGTFPGISALLHFVVVLLWFRAFAAVVVRRSIERGISSVMQEVRRRPAGGNSNPTVLIGFSWGGAVRFKISCWKQHGRKMV